MSNFTPAILVSFGILALSDKMDNGIPVSTYWAFAIGAIASIGTILVTVITTSEYPPTEEELAVIKANKAKGNAFFKIVK
jgi:maltose/moltooligosaccharide transporter